MSYVKLINDNTIAVAESLTGGLLVSSIVDISGSSAYFKGGIIAYSYESKSDILKCSNELVKETCGVHPTIVLQMAKEVSIIFKSTIGVATTGFAESFDDKPSMAYIGLVWPAKSISQYIIINNSGYARNEFRNIVVNEAINLLNKILSQHNDSNITPADVSSNSK